MSIAPDNASMKQSFKRHILKELIKAKTEAEASRLERACESLDRQIDQAV